MSAPAMPRILAVDDDPDTRSNLIDILALDGYEVETAGSLAEVMRRQDWSQLAAIILDRRLPDGSADTALPRLKQLAPDAAIIIVTGFADLEGAIAAIRQGASDYLLKPINPDLLRSRLAGLVERRRAAAEIARLNTDLRRRVTELQALLDLVPIGIAIAQDAKAHTIVANAALATMLRAQPGTNVSVSAPGGTGYPFRIRRNERELTPDEMPMQIAATQGKEVRDVEMDVVHPDGDVVHLYGHAVPLFDEAGQPRGAVGAFLDITERKREQQKALQRERLAAIGEMMAGLAHESGNALARSQACLEMLTWEVEDRPEALELIRSVQAAQTHLKQLYEDVRGYAGPIKLQSESWDVRLVWRQAWENLALARKGRDATLVEETNGVETQCLADPFRLGQVFRNVFENALAACRDPVRICVVCAPSRLGEEPALSMCVRDNGPGLNAEQQQRIFEPFFTTKTKGTGLGMAIAKRVVEAHGGKMIAGNRSEGGAEIVITLPWQAS